MKPGLEAGLSNVARGQELKISKYAGSPVSHLQFSAFRRFSSERCVTVIHK